MNNSLICIDTNIWIYFFAQKEPFAQELEQYLSNRRAVTTAINIAELFAGAKSEEEENFIQKIVETIPVLDVTSVSASLAGTIQKKLLKEKRKNGFADCLIAACCLIHNVSLFTNNPKDFEHIETLQLIRML